MPFDGEEVAAALAKVTATLPDGGEGHPGQVAMAEAVARAIHEQNHLVVQAGTGTGNSLACLTPLATLGVKAVVARSAKSPRDVRETA